MKKVLCLFLCLLPVLACGCTPQKQEDSFSVVATIFPYYDFARQIAGEEGEVSMLIPPGGEVHGFEPDLQDLALIEGCDVFLYNGGGDDGWVETLLSKVDTSDMEIVRLMDCVELLAVGEEHHHEGHHHDHHEVDEHIFTTPQNALQIARAIYGAMEKAAGGAGGFRENYEQLQGELTALLAGYEALRGAENTLVVADRFPFLYLTHAYGLSYLSAFTGCSAGTEGDLKTLYEMKTAAESYGNKRVLCTEFSDGKLASAVADAVGGQVLRWHSCHNVTAEEWQNKVTYVELMKENLKVLKEVLGL